MRKVKGFTLIELLMVISIVVLLMAILLPVVQRVRNQARAMVCQANLKQWGTILAIYTEDNQGRLPMGPSDTLWLLRGSFLSEDDPNNKPSVYQDINARGIALCPMAVRPGPRGHGSTFEAWEITIPLPPFRCSYGLNEGRGWAFDTSVPIRLSTRRFGADVFSIMGMANIPTLLDSTRYWVHSPIRPPMSEFAERSVEHSVCINRHNGHINVLFMDWSVRKVGLKELWILKWHSSWDTAGPWTKAGGVKPEDWPEWMRRFKDY